MLDPGTNFPDQHFLRLNSNYNSPEFGAEKKLIEDEDSGISSPPLWRTSPPRNPQNRRQHHYRSLSPSSRAQAIARGQKELMEMVSRMPEGCYELSLKDIVEQSMVNEDQVKEDSFSKQRSVRKNEDKEKDKKRKMSRIGSIDNGGFLIKMVFPISFGSTNNKKKMKNKSNNENSNIRNYNTGMNSNGRVSPRPLLMDGSGNGENEWWKKRNSEAEESESGIFSSNSGSSKSSGSISSRSSSRNSTSRKGGGSCWPFIFRKRGKKPE